MKGLEKKQRKPHIYIYMARYSPTVVVFTSQKKKTFLFFKFMSLLNMTNRAQIHEVYKKVDIRNVLIFQTQF